MNLFRFSCLSKEPRTVVCGRRRNHCGLSYFESFIYRSMVHEEAFVKTRFFSQIISAPTKLMRCS
jgi:hypothetical protein